MPGGQQGKQRCFAAAIGAQQGGFIAVAQGEMYVPQDFRAVGIPEVQMVDLQNGGASRRVREKSSWMAGSSFTRSTFSRCSKRVSVALRR